MGADGGARCCEVADIVWGIGVAGAAGWWGAICEEVKR